MLSDHYPEALKRALNPVPIAHTRVYGSLYDRYHKLQAALHRHRK